jgi:hypothetical protein
MKKVVIIITLIIIAAFVATMGCTSAPETRETREITVFAKVLIGRSIVTVDGTVVDAEGNKYDVNGDSLYYGLNEGRNYTVDVRVWGDGTKSITAVRW